MSSNDIIEGKRPVIEALRSGAPLVCVYLADNLQRDGLVEDIQRKASQRDIPVKQVPRKKLDAMGQSNTHQGVIAQAKPFSYAALEDVIAAADGYAADHDGRALIVVLDHITDAGNLGAIIRSAESVGAGGIVIANKRAAQVTAATFKTSAGAVAHVPVARVANIAQAVTLLQEAGYWVVAATEHATQPVWDVNLSGKAVIVMGSEDEGISRRVQELCDFPVMLPMCGKVESLNVAQAATVFFYEWLRQNTAAGDRP